MHLLGIGDRVEMDGQVGNVIGFVGLRNKVGDLNGVLVRVSVGEHGSRLIPGSVFEELLCNR